MQILKSVLLLFAVPFVAVAGNVSVKSVTAQQQHPWNGLVDIVVTLQGSAEVVAKADCQFVATNSATQTAIPVEHISQDEADYGFRQCLDTEVCQGCVLVKVMGVVINGVGYSEASVKK